MEKRIERVREKRKEKGLLHVEVPGFDKILGHFPLKGETQKMELLENFNRKKITHLAKTKSVVKFRGLLEHKGSVVLSIEKPKAEIDEEGGLGAPFKRVLPFTSMDSYHVRSGGGEIVDNFVVVRRLDNELKLSARDAEGGVNFVKKFLRELESRNLARLTVDFDRIKDKKTLLKKLKKECSVDEEILKLDEISNHENLVKKIREKNALDHHLESVQGEKKFDTMHFVGDFTGRFREATSSERDLFRKIGVKPTKFVFELVDAKENKDVSPVDVLKRFSEGR